MGRWFQWRGGITAALLCLSACSTANSSERVTAREAAFEVETPRRDIEPIPVSLDAANAAAGKLPRLRSLLVDRRGDLILEKYFNGARPQQPANIKSASKVVISALVGIAIGRGLISGVDAPIGPFFPKLLAAEADAGKQAITIEDLLTMRSGLESTSSRNYGAWVHSSNWVRHALTRRLVAKPGESMDYSTGNTHLLSAILTKVSGKSTWKFAQDALAEPLGFTLTPWPSDPQGIYFGGNDMEMTPRQMLAFGKLYLAGGEANGRQIVPADWIKESVLPRTLSGRSRRLYGYGWWIRELAGCVTYYAWGFGGQFIFVLPDLDVVVVATSSDAPGGERHGHRDALYEMVAEHVVAPIKRSEAAAGAHTAGTLPGDRMIRPLPGAFPLLQQWESGTQTD
jgi:CubicO group peptidase (beta-lactamase class C family)